MEIRHLRYFCGVAEHKSFSAASARLHVTQPSLSRQIRDLEDELGVQLFIRSSSGVSLTDAGEAFYGHAARMLAQLSIAISAAQEVGKGKGGEFIIGGDWRLPLDAIPQAVMQIRKLYPKVKVQLLDLPMHEHAMALRDRRIHIGFVPNVYMEWGEDLESKRIIRSGLVTIMPRNHRLAGATSLRLVDLKDEIWILADEKASPGVRASYEKMFRLSQISPKLGPTANTIQGLLARVGAGDGVALMPRTLLPERTPMLALVPTEVEPFEMHAIWPSKGASPLVLPFLEILCHALGSPAKDA